MRAKTNRALLVLWASPCDTQTPNSGLTIINGSYGGVAHGLHLGPLQQGLGWSRTLGILKPVFGGWADINMSYEKVV